jgi:hypothetical protein
VTGGWHRNTELKAIVGDLLALGYAPASIARVTNRTPERICQIRRELGLTPPRLRTVDDLPLDMRTRLVLFLSSESEGTDQQ